MQDSDGARRWVVVVKGTFDIKPDGTLSLADEQVDPLLAPEYLGEDGVSSLRYEADLIAPKPGTDVYVVGHAHAPNGRPTTQMSVALGVADRRKILNVVGDRIWIKDLVGEVAPSSPAPFVKMPIVYERAYGGHDTTSPDLAKQRLFTPNPVGTGHVARKLHLADQPVANIEFPTGPDARAAAGFGAICSYWSPRIEHGGTYDAKWIETRKPLLPDDFDPRFHMCAPLDQQFIPHLRGGTGIELVNLHPSGALRFALPKIFLSFTTTIALRRSERQQEHRAVLHTVILEPDHPRVILVWHTSLPCHHEPDYLESTSIREKPYL